MYIYVYIYIYIHMMLQLCYRGVRSGSRRSAGFSGILRREEAERRSLSVRRRDSRVHNSFGCAAEISLGHVFWRVFAIVSHAVPHSHVWDMVVYFVYKQHV